MSTDTTTDEFAGHGGSYLLDPATGVRTLVERTEDPAQTPAEQPAAADAAQE